MTYQWREPCPVNLLSQQQRTSHLYTGLPALYLFLLSLSYSLSQSICRYVIVLSCLVITSLLLQPPAVPLPPPYDPQYKLQDGKPVTQELYDTLTAMFKQMNDAINSLSPLTPAKTAAAA